MSADLVMVQESVKLALDAADAAADVTAEYNKVKKENKKCWGGSIRFTECQASLPLLRRL